MSGVEWTRAHQRLLDELDDDGISLPGSPEQIATIITELEHARRPPVFENRTNMYGSFVLQTEQSLLVNDQLIEILDLDMRLDEARRFADGRSSFLVRRIDGRLQLACFRRTIQYEADLIEVEASTGASIVQRTLMGVPRLVTPTGVIEWTGNAWRHRLSAAAHLPAARAAVPEASVPLLAGLLDLAIHWLSPARRGATFLLDLQPRGHDDHGLDLSAALPSPELSVLRRHHYPALFAALSQTDLATLVEIDGSIDRLGVGLRSSTESEAVVQLGEGMRHRSAARYTWDHHHTVAFVVSEDGPVTLFRRGEPIAICVDGHPGPSERPGLGETARR